ncbi:MAG: nickel pincer cofactor biosynthesis protein LarC [Oscillospiraceae bacterium]|jgi:uncharacterized protein (TIGR00299 family) protein|nr:nickel pincer cofactor biosynthesis protein LarC [Oscillospiraceae bacterium]
MKILYLDCQMGAAGDMITAALLDVLKSSEEAKALVYKIAAAIPGAEVEITDEKRGGISGIHLSVRINGEEEHAPDGDHFGHGHVHNHEEGGHSHGGYGLKEIEEIIGGLPVSAAVKAKAKDVYQLIAGAESEVHGEPVETIHFHELGALDAVFDVTAACAMFELINADQICCGTVNVGGGVVRTAHGVMSVPTPASELLLSGILTRGDAGIKTELCTPTGAALLKTFAKYVPERPAMTADSVGFGLGTKDFPNRSNAVKAVLGTAEDSAGVVPNDEIAELSCNIDDMTGEQLGYAAERLRGRGALDVALIPATGKKNRPMIILKVMCKASAESEFAQLILKETSTFGVRAASFRRYTLEREFTTGKDGVVIKRGWGYGIEKSKQEFDTITRSEL